MMDADIPAFGFLYCIIMMIIGQFFLMNLFLAVIVFSFIKSQKQDVENEIVALEIETELKEPNDGDNAEKISNTQHPIKRSWDVDRWKKGKFIQ